MNNIFIDYKLFLVYEKEYFIKNKILPICENDISLDFYVCKESRLENIHNDFNKVLKFKEIHTNELLFLLSYIDIKISLYELASKAIDKINSNDKFIEDFLECLINFSIITRASDIHIEQFEELVLFRFRVDGKLKTFFSYETFKSDFFVYKTYFKFGYHTNKITTRW